MGAYNPTGGGKQVNEDNFKDSAQFPMASLYTDDIGNNQEVFIKIC